jgi:hypothetical protein
MINYWCNYVHLHANPSIQRQCTVKVALLYRSVSKVNLLADSVLVFACESVMISSEVMLGICIRVIADALAVILLSLIRSVLSFACAVILLDLSCICMCRDTT